LERLRKKLLQIDGKGYKAYKEIQGSYQGQNFSLHIDYVQGDPFASPSRIRVVIPQQIFSYKKEWIETDVRKIAFEDFFAREIALIIQKESPYKNGSGKSGLIYIDAPGQEILPRTSVCVDDQKLEIRLSVGLPAQGRKILGKSASELLHKKIPEIIKQAVFHYNSKRLNRHLQLADQQAAIRHYINEQGYIAFIANGSILPRKSGVSNKPLEKEQAIPFQSPASFEIEIPLPHRSPIKGMGIPQGITLIVGGGYHGKSTLLKAIERGVYNHVLGDGREFVITNQNAMKIRAEDGRRIEKVNISPFISQLPFGKDTVQFSTDDASGSTSQAANIMEALEAGSEVLLIDEDTSATNFMIRDARMQDLVKKEKEPITPFIDKVRQLYEDYQVSTILVIGGSGDYFEVADPVIMMDEYKPIDRTKEAKEIAERRKYDRTKEGGNYFGKITNRLLQPTSFHAYKGKKEKIDAKGLNTIIYGTNQIDLSFVEQLIDPSQTRAIALMIKYISKNLVDGTIGLSKLIDLLYQEIKKEGLEVISPFLGQHPGDLALPRKLELAAAINRLRSLKVKIMD